MPLNRFKNDKNEWVYTVAREDTDGNMITDIKLFAEDGAGNKIPVKTDASGNVLTQLTGSTDELPVNVNGGTLIEPKFDDTSYSWWIEPLSIRHKGTYDKTYTGFVSSDGKIGVTSVDNNTFEKDSFVLNDFEGDDHNAASVNVLPDGRIICVYSRHNMDQSIRVRISDNPEDISSFGSEYVATSSGNTTYAQTVVYDGKFHIFYRVGTTNWAYRRFSPANGTFSNEVIWLETPYQYYVKIKHAPHAPQLVRMAMYGHPINSTDHNIYFGFFRFGGASSDIGRIDSITDSSNGNFVEVGHLETGSNLPLAQTDFMEAHTAGAGSNTRMFDVAYDDEISILFASFTDETDAMYKIATFNGDTRAFETRDIKEAGLPIETPQGANYYFGGVHFESNGIDTVYVSRENNGVWMLERVVDNGVSWDVAEVIQADKEKTYRPSVPINQSRNVPVLWVKGKYQGYKNYYTDIYFGRNEILNTGSDYMKMQSVKMDRMIKLLEEILLK